MTDWKNRIADFLVVFDGNKRELVGQQIGAALEMADHVLGYTARARIKQPLEPDRDRLKDMLNLASRDEWEQLTETDMRMLATASSGVKRALRK